jgi:predicted PurR-regulated permease PerM
MIFLCVICTWHAVVSLIDNIDLYQTFNGYITKSDEEWIEYYKNPNNNIVQVYFDSFRNKTMITKSITLGEKLDRIALCLFAAIYVFVHFIFILSMYFMAYKRRRIMYEKDRKYKVLKFLVSEINSKDKFLYYF